MAKSFPRWLFGNDQDSALQAYPARRRAHKPLGDRSGVPPLHGDRPGRAGREPTAMNSHRLPDCLRRLLLRSVSHRYYSLVVTAIAFWSTLTFSFPFVIVLVPAVLLSPRRWRALGLLCGIASGLGAAALVEIFRYLGSAFVVARYPELMRADAWQTASEWLQQWGLLAMLIIAGSPIPQTPALLFCALANVSTLGILIAVAIGKTVKYLLLAWRCASSRAMFPRA